MYGTYTPNLGPFGAGPDLVMHLPISDFSENCDPLYAPPAQFWTAAAFYKLPTATTHLHEQLVAAYVAAATAYSPEASPQPPPAGSALPVDHAPAASTSLRLHVREDRARPSSCPLLDVIYSKMKTEAAAKTSYCPQCDPQQFGF